MFEDYTEDITTPEEIVPEPYVPTICTIKLADGTALDNLELNGNNYIAPGIIEDAVFAGNLDTVEITQTRGAETTTTICHDMTLVQNTTRFGGGTQSWFVLAEMPLEEMDRAALEAEITALQLALVEMYEGRL